MVFPNVLSTTRRAFTAAMAAGILLTLPVQAAELVMVEQPNCEWCARWDEEIGPIYPKTSEGRFAPLRRVDLRDLPGELDVARRVNFTPTFLIIEDQREIGRLEGYPGEDFFWPVIAQLLSKHAGYVAEDATPKDPGS
ncbi:hypothetical protein [Zongyanglinia huanghaiensis]|uniref:Regulatory protein SoxS n=1 Tax=Parasedimentitalea huanghaiensis TaxID=2682100 RepID=A0A6L6WKF3_9RHOB|nr:hypothetical protein [Zongyanglinia huanghaiensis]